MAFFPEAEKMKHHPDRSEESYSKETKLYVGSVKTVMGHTEGAAGLVSLLKASLAVKYGIIMPNLHFERLNPSVEPYYKHLKIPTSPQSWPELRDGLPRRASVNSFGFGGMRSNFRDKLQEDIDCC
ncbi:thiolase-like protein [Xylariaceae sp. FL0255]|nr:thiolase-like protein [Xylariaceae sp. FL0255]